MLSVVDAAVADVGLLLVVVRIAFEKIRAVVVVAVADVAVVEDGVLVAVVRIAFEKIRAVVVAVADVAVADVGVETCYCQDRFREDQGCRCPLLLSLSLMVGFQLLVIVRISFEKIGAVVVAAVVGVLLVITCH